MPWLPLADSGIAYEFLVYDPGTDQDVPGLPKDVTFNEGDSTLTLAPPVAEDSYPEWTLRFADSASVRVRVTTSSFSASVYGGYTPAYFSYGTDVLPSDPIDNIADSSGAFVTEFLPSPFEVETVVRTSDSRPPYLYYGPTNATETGGADRSWSFLLEVWVESSEDMNCDCDETYERKTLLEMYQRVMRRMGYGSQLARPPPGVKETVFDYIREAQTLTIADFDEIGHKRLFKWDMAIGQRFYSLDENVDTCTKLLNALTIMGVWVRPGGQEKGIFNRLRRMEPVIPPEWYSGGIYNSWPTHYAQRSCLEVWPPPSEPMELIILGKYKNLPLEVDGDYTTADPEAIFLRTIAFYKAAKGHADANVYMGQYGQYLGNLNADQHRDVRNVPPWDVDGFCIDRYLDDRLVRVMDPLVYGP